MRLFKIFLLLQCIYSCLVAAGYSDQQYYKLLPPDVKYHSDNNFTYSKFMSLQDNQFFHPSAERIHVYSSEFRSINVKDAQYKGHQYSDSYMNNAIFARLVWADSGFSGVQFNNSLFKEVTFVNSDLNQVEFKNSRFNYVYFFDSELDQTVKELLENKATVYIGLESLEAAALNEETVVGPNFYHMMIERMNVTGLRFNRAKSNGSTFKKSFFRNAVVSNSDILLSHFTDIKAFRFKAMDTSIRYSTFKNADFSESSFKNVTITNSHFENVNFKGSNWENVRITNSTFKDCQFLKAKRRGLYVKNSKGFPEDES